MILTSILVGALLVCTVVSAKDYGDCNMKNVDPTITDVDFCYHSCRGKYVDFSMAWMCFGPDNICCCSKNGVDFGPIRETDPSQYNCGPHTIYTTQPPNPYNPPIYRTTPPPIDCDPHDCRDFCSSKGYLWHNCNPSPSAEKNQVYLQNYCYCWDEAVSNWVTRVLTNLGL